MELSEEPETGASAEAGEGAEGAEEAAAGEQIAESASAEGPQAAAEEPGTSLGEAEGAGEEISMDDSSSFPSFSEVYEESSHDGQSFWKRIAPYLTVAGVLLILRIVLYSLRRRRR